MIQGLSEGYTETVWYHTFSAENASKGQNRLVIHVQISTTWLRSTTCPWVGGKMGSAKIWVSIYQQLPVSDLSADVSLTHWTPFPQQIPLVMMRPITSTAQSIPNAESEELHDNVLCLNFLLSIANDSTAEPHCAWWIVSAENRLGFTLRICRLAKQMTCSTLYWSFCHFCQEDIF